MAGMVDEDLMMGRINALTESVIGAAIEVHRELGPGLLESVYEKALCRELTLRQIPYERQVQVPLDYKGASLDAHLRLDLVVDRSLILELKAVDHLLPIHEAQLLTYLKLSHLPVGLLLNFYETRLKNGIKRLARTQSP